jgi:hypothetical protein
VLAVNSIQFLGSDGDACLRRLLAAVTAGGVCGISIFSHQQHAKSQRYRLTEPENHLWLLSLEELMEYFAGWQMLEAAQVWQWNPHTNQPQPFATLIARNVPPADAHVRLP